MIKAGQQRFMLQDKHGGLLLWVGSIANSGAQCDRANINSILLSALKVIKRKNAR